MRQAMARLSNTQFRYIPAEATNVLETWRRFGFDTRLNEERRAQGGERNSRPVVSARISPLPRVVRPRYAGKSAS
jgi:hypothetical protein